MPRQWTPDDINRLMRAYQGACVVGAAAELDLFAHLAKGPMTAPALAQALQSDRRATTMLLDALAAMELLTKTADTYALSPGIDQALVHGASGSVLAMTRHQTNCLRRWADLARTVKSGQPAPREPSIRGTAGDQQSFIEAMNDISGPVAQRVVNDVNVVPFTTVLDVGGASGTWTLAWLAANPKARAILFDLPHVIPMARQRLEAAGAIDRVTLVPGDMTTDAMPRGADLAWISAIIHMQGQAENRALYGRVAAALPSGGHIMIRDIVMDASRTQPPGGALFAINMLTATDTGGTFTFDEIRADLASAGFTNTRQIRQDPWMDSVIVAQKQ